MSITLQFNFLIDDVMTDVTSAVLSDPTGTFGVKRDDTDAVVVADGTAMTRVDTGRYEHTFTEPVAGLTYTYYVEYVYDGATYRSSYTYTDATRVVSLPDMKDQLAVDGTDLDTYIGDLIDAATVYCEKATGLKFLTAACIDTLESFPAVIRPTFSPLSSVTSIQYVDTAGATQTWSSSEYDVDTDPTPGRIQPAYNESYPSIRGQMQAITVTYVAGYGTSASDVPENLRQAVKILVTEWFYRRGEVTEGNLPAIPRAVDILLGLSKVYRL